MGVVDAGINNANNIFDRTCADVPGLISLDPSATALHAPEAANSGIVRDKFNRYLLVNFGKDDTGLFSVSVNNGFCARRSWDF